MENILEIGLIRKMVTLHPDLNHEPPIDPHWDYNDDWRVFDDGTIKPKVTIPKIPLFD